MSIRKINRLINSCLLTIVAGLFWVPSGISQADGRPNQETHSVKIKKAIDEIKLDGVLDEVSWKQADIASDFWQRTPRDDVKAALETEGMLTYDHEMLYVAIICRDSTNHVVSTLKRDIGYWDGDAVGVILDPLNEASSGFMFGATPYGVQTDVLCGGGSGSGNYNEEWDNRWYVEAKIYEDRWIVEMAIPFKTLRYEAGKSTWGINFMRNDKKNNRVDAWAPIPLQFWLIDLGYTGRLEWDAAPTRNKGNIALVPYVNTSSNTDFEEGTPTDLAFSAGLDAKIALSSALNLDLTVNPDFSQVEVDQQVTNLTRFSIFLPERRTFFLENSDIFSRFGFRDARPFFSRRIGLDEEGRAVPILFGARLTGNATGTTRVGLLNVQTKATDDQLAQNYTAASFNQRVFKRSSLQGMFVNRQAFKEGEVRSTDYGRNASLKFNYLNSNGTFEFWTGAHRSFKHGIDEDQYFFENGAEYSGKQFSAEFNHNFVGTNYFADVGFINMVENYDAEKDTTIRLGYHFLRLPLEFRFLPKNSKLLNQHSIEFNSGYILDPEGGFVERGNAIEYQMNFKNSSEFQIELENKETDLRFPFSFTDGTPLPVGRYNYTQVDFSYDSDERKLLVFELDISAGTFYNGSLLSAGAGLLYRTQPWGNFGVEVEYNRLRFPDSYGEETIWAFSPRVEISFNRNLFWTTFLQYNTQADNFNINSRFQWRFAPMSDVFLVYTDNYAVENFGKKNRAIVLKVNYWLVI